MTWSIDDREFGLLLLGVIGTVILVPVLFMGAGIAGIDATMGAQWPDATVSDWTPVVAALIQLLFAAVVVGGGYLAFDAVAGDRATPPRQRAPAAT